MGRGKGGEEEGGRGGGKEGGKGRGRGGKHGACLRERKNIS